MPKHLITFLFAPALLSSYGSSSQDPIPTQDFGQKAK